MAEILDSKDIPKGKAREILFRSDRVAEWIVGLFWAAALGLLAYKVWESWR